MAEITVALPLEIDIGQEEEEALKKTTGDTAAENHNNNNKIKKNHCPWLYDLRTSYAGGCLVWVALLATMFMVLNKFHDKNGDDDGTDDDTYSNATSCDDDAAESLEGLAARFFDESCVAALTCEDQAVLFLFMHEFLSPLRVEMVLFNQVYLLINFMVVQQGVPTWLGGVVGGWVEGGGGGGGGQVETKNLNIQLHGGG